MEPSTTENRTTGPKSYLNNKIHYELEKTVWMIDQWVGKRWVVDLSCLCNRTSYGCAKVEKKKGWLQWKEEVIKKNN